MKARVRPKIFDVYLKSGAGGEGEERDEGVKGWDKILVRYLFILTRVDMR